MRLKRSRPSRPYCGSSGTRMEFSPSSPFSIDCLCHSYTIQLQIITLFAHMIETKPFVVARPVQFLFDRNHQAILPISNQAPSVHSAFRQKPQDVASEMDGENTVISEMDGRGRSTHREAGEKDGFPVARPQTAAGEMDAGGGR